MFSKNKSYTTESIMWLNGSPLSFMSDLNSVWLLQVQYYCGHRTVSTPCENMFLFFATSIIMLCLLSHKVDCKRACGGLQIVSKYKGVRQPQPAGLSVPVLTCHV